MSYKAGIIGTGGIAGMGILGLHDEEDIGERKFESSHAGGYYNNDNIKLVAAADINQEKLEKFGHAWDIKPDNQYRDHNEMLCSEDFDVVSICSPTFYHHEHVIDVTESSNSPSVIWCEKPIASSVSDAERMISSCEENDIELVINHSFRFADKIRYLKEEVNKGLIGEVKSITAQFRRELLRNSTHLLDTLIFLLDARAEDVYGYINDKNDAVSSLDGHTEVDDAGGGGMVIMDDGTMILIDCTISREISSMNIQIIGTEGKLSLNNDDGEWRYWALEKSGHVEQPIPSIDGGWDWESDYTDAFPNAVDHIVDLIQGKSSNLSPGHKANRSMEIITAFYISHYTRGKISIPLDRPLKDVTITSW